MPYVRGPSLQRRLDDEGPLGAGGNPPRRHASRRRAGRRPCPRARPPRREARQHPAGRRRRAGEADRFRPGPCGRRRQPDEDRHHRRHAAVHVARTGPRRAGRPAERLVQPGQRAVCDVYRPRAVPRGNELRRAAADHGRRAPTDPRDQPGDPRMALPDRRQAHGQAARRPFPVGPGSRRATGRMPGPRPATDGRALAHRTHLAPPR